MLGHGSFNLEQHPCADIAWLPVKSHAGPVYWVVCFARTSFVLVLAFLFAAVCFACKAVRCSDTQCVVVSKQEVEQRKLPAGTKVLEQPQDGNCLFHGIAVIAVGLQNFDKEHVYTVAEITARKLASPPHSPRPSQKEHQQKPPKRPEQKPPMIPESALA